jgi:hypothetical protein
VRLSVGVCCLSVVSQSLILPVSQSVRQTASPILTFYTLAPVRAGFSTDGTLPLDGVSQWAAILGGSNPTRTMIVIGNSTNECSWTAEDPRYHLSASPERDGADLPAGHWTDGAALQCGFAIKDYR